MRLAIALALSAALAGPGYAQSAPPVEVGPPDAPDQRPAFEGQTRAPQPDNPVPVATRIVATGLPKLWALEFLPDGRMLVTANSGSMHILTENGHVGPMIAGVPSVDSRGQGGLLDLALDPDFASNHQIYFSYAEPRGDGVNGTSVATATLELREGNTAALKGVRVIFRQKPGYAGTKHFGSRLAFAPDGTLFVTTGERSDTPIRDSAQALDAGMGKIFRINRDGTVPDDNPFAGREDVQPAIWSYGHRNLQSALVDADGRLWTVEHGPRGGDELNRPQAGLNYGWPVITYGVDYSGAPIGEGLTQMEGMEQPVYYWDPVIAPSGMAQYEGDQFPQWRGRFLVGGLKARAVVVLDVKDDKVVTEAWVPLNARVRDVKVGPDGAVYAVTETGNSSNIVKLVPRKGS
ncbi:PQQ-dependent sugar dehydrogenase [Acuticoccus sp. I52.16.1]|uniref:PQQ-dependent sugar dehydrogenase n=1 Tax=Acuticoccus sp. I52.16.1 TaxID=2928472 RepID=UPI001FD5A805|nr:PQQ-dependent sugar dehydrogenase [Acuticoccus sp. I52.16.1]UOM35181.1 PQQ-dependent sugar dehydrogenase [Acuticoccus sp. I52.16.1]